MTNQQKTDNASGVAFEPLVGRNPVLRLFSNEFGQHLAVTHRVGICEPLSHLGLACHTVAWFMIGHRYDLAVSTRF